MGNWDNAISRIVNGVQNKINSAINSHNSNNNSHTDIRASVNGKVDKETGKGLSTNDYTTTEKNKLEGIETGANKYTHPSYTAQTNGLYKITVDTLGHISATASVTGSDLPSHSHTWSSVTDKPSTYPPSSHTHNIDDVDDLNQYLEDVYEEILYVEDDVSTHTHGNISHDGAVGSVSNLPLITGANGVVITGTFGSTANTFCQGNDSRLSDARTPLSHNHSITDITNLQTTLSDLNNRISSVESLEYIKIVTTLPSASSSTMNTLYLLSKSGSYDIYITIKDGSTYFWEKLDEDILDDLSIDWLDIENKPSTFNPSSHTHGNITNNGAVGTTANKPLITTTNGVISTGSFGTTANTFCQGNDSRLSDARTPLSHTHGNITNTGSITTSKSSIISNDKLIISDSESSSVLKSASVVDVLNRVVLDLIDEAE